MTIRFQSPPVMGYFEMPAVFHEGFKVAPRHIVEAIVEQLVEMLDRADGDADLEDDDEDRCEGRDDDLAFRYQDGGAGDPDDGDPYMDEEDEHDREGVEFG